MVLRGCVAAGRRGLTSSTAAAAPGASAVPAKLILGQPPRVWAMRAGHAAFVMLASMYLMTDMVLLRILGIVANGLDMFYCFLVAEAPLWLNIRWGAFYVLVNLVQLGQLYWEQRKVEMDAVQSEMFATHFLQHGMTQSQFVMLYRLGTVHEFSVDEPIIVEGQPANMVTLLLDGTVAVSVGEEGVAVQQGGSWLGAIEYLGRADDESFGATAVATATVKAIQWPVDALRGCCSRNPALSLPLSSVLSEEIQESLIQHEQFSRLASYRAVLAGVLADATITDDEHAFILRYRTRHAITPIEHAAALKSVGYTREKYRMAVERQDCRHYHGTVAGILADGHVEPAERTFLERYRSRHQIPAEEHELAVDACGWTIDEFDAGQKATASTRGDHD